MRALVAWAVALTMVAAVAPERAAAQRRPPPRPRTQVQTRRKRVRCSRSNNSCDVYQSAGSVLLRATPRSSQAVTGRVSNMAPP